MLLTGALCVGIIAGCGKADADAKNDGAAETTTTQATDSDDANAAADATDGEARTKLVVGFDAEFPPYGYMDDNGEYTGFDLELAQEVCNRKGWELVKQPIDWDAKDMELSSGSIDCIWNGFTMTGREAEYTWSVPYVDNSQVFVVKASSNITSQADLEGKSVGVQKDSSALAALEGDAATLCETFGELIQYADYNTAFMDLEAGATDAVAIDKGVADYQLKERGDEYVILDEQLATEQYAIGFLLGNTELKDEVEAVLLEMVADGTFATIAQKYELTDSVCLGK